MPETHDLSELGIRVPITRQDRERVVKLLQTRLGVEVRHLRRGKVRIYSDYEQSMINAVASGPIGWTNRFTDAGQLHQISKLLSDDGLSYEATIFEAASRVVKSRGV